jgi:hypothetical protein
MLVKGVKIIKQDRIQEESGTIIGSQFELNDRWVFSSISECLAFIETPYFLGGPMQQKRPAGFSAGL